MSGVPPGVVAGAANELLKRGGSALASSQPVTGNQKVGELLVRGAAIVAPTAVAASAAVAATVAPLALAAAGGYVAWRIGKWVYNEFF